MIEYLADRAGDGVPFPRPAGVHGPPGSSYDRSVAVGTAPGDVDLVLSRHEREVMECATQGMTDAQIAEQLSVSPHAMMYHVESTYRNLRVANRTAAAVRFWDQTNGSRVPAPGMVA